MYPLSAQFFLVIYLARFAEPILFETDSSITEETRIPLLGGLNLTLDGTTKFRDMFFTCEKVYIVWFFDNLLKQFFPSQSFFNKICVVLQWNISPFNVVNFQWRDSSIFAIQSCSPPPLNTPNRGWSRWDGILQAAKSTRFLYPLVLTRAKVLQRQAGWSLFFPFGEHNTPLNKIYMGPKKTHHWKGKSSSKSPILRGQNVASKWLFVLPFFGRLNETQEQSINPLMALQQYQVGTSCRVGRVPYTFWKARLLFGCRQQ